PLRSSAGSRSNAQPGLLEGDHSGDYARNHYRFPFGLYTIYRRLCHQLLYNGIWGIHPFYHRLLHGKKGNKPQDQRTFYANVSPGSGAPGYCERASRTGRKKGKAWEKWFKSAHWESFS